MKRSSKNHGMSKTSEYRSWVCMRFRCYNPNNPAYSRYGARGIKVCDRWLESFENFINDMGKKPSDKHSIDRIDNNKDYFRENCKWSDDTGISQHSIARRIRNGFNPIDCIKPVRITKLK